MRSSTLVTTVLLVTASALHAQSAAAPVRRSVLAINPFATVAGFVTGDFERTVSPSVSLGIGGSVALADEFNEYRALDAKVRYYPNERMLEGFAIAATFGVASGRSEIFDFNTQSVAFQRETRGTFGTELSYQWLLGPRRRFVTIVGVGAKRVIGSEPYVRPFDSQFIPTARANIGFAF
jgi:hypothetical protein